MNELYHCAIENGAQASVKYNSLEKDVIAMNSHFEEINLWWHPGLNIAMSIIPIAGILAAYSYLILGVTLSLTRSIEFLRSNRAGIRSIIHFMIPGWKNGSLPR